MDLQSLQPTALTDQVSSGTMQGQFLNNSQLLVQPQTAKAVSLKSQTLTPLKPLNASAKPASELIADSTPLHQVFVAEIIFLTGPFVDHKQLRGGWKLYTVACVLSLLAAISHGEAKMRERGETPAGSRHALAFN